MGEVVAQARSGGLGSNPNAFREIPPFEARGILEREEAARAQRERDWGQMSPRRGWQEDRPVALPVAPGSFVDGVMGQMIDAAVGPVLSPREKLKAGLRALPPAQRAELLAGCDARGDKTAVELKALALEVWK